MAKIGTKFKVSDELTDSDTPALASKQDDIVTAINNIDANFNTNEIEEASATVTYLGMEDRDGVWYVQKIDTTSGNSFQYATVNNNPTRTSYTLGWTNRATLTYEDYGEAF